MKSEQDSKKKIEEERLWSSDTEDPGAVANSFFFQAPPAIFVMLLVVLLALSLSIVYSATITEFGDHYFKMQMLWIGIGAVAFVVAAFFPMRFLYRYALVGLILVAIPLLYLGLAKVVSSVNASYLSWFPGANEINGAVRWLRFGGIQVQPSEFAKLVLLIFLSGFYGRLSRSEIKKFVPGVLIPGACAGLILGLVMLGKDLSTTVITAGTCFTIMFLAGIRLRYVFAIMIIGISVVAFAICSSPMRLNRMTAYLEPEKHKDNESYQLYRSQLCLGLGGPTGSGYSQGYMKSYLPESYTDFIVAVLGEEFGAVGVLGLLAIYTLLCACIFAIAKQCRQRQDLLFCLGVTMLIALQAMVNMGVVTGWCPPTGVTAPFLSYGGSSMMSLMFLAGLVLNVSTRNYRAGMDEMSNQRCILNQ